MNSDKETVLWIGLGGMIPNVGMAVQGQPITLSKGLAASYRQQGKCKSMPIPKPHKEKED